MRSNMGRQMEHVEKKRLRHRGEERLGCRPQLARYLQLNDT